MNFLHNHICPTCLQEFSGRLNKKFCSVDCKTYYNNNKARELRMKLSDKQILQDNLKILMLLYHESEGERSLSKIKLLKRGFDFGAWTRQMKTFKLGIECFFVHSLAYSVSRDGKQITIYTEDDLKNK